MRILIVADDPLTRTGLATLVAAQSDHSVVGQVAGDSNLAADLNAFLPDVLIWDMGWQPEPALERLADLGDMPQAVIALLADEIHAADAWATGARGLFLRHTRIDQVLAAVTPVAQGLLVIDPALGKTLLAPRERPAAPPLEPLTGRELEVLQLLAQGLANKRIAQQLRISESTVKFHVNAIMSKLGAQSRTDAVVRATRSGLVIL